MVQFLALSCHYHTETHIINSNTYGSPERKVGKIFWWWRIIFLSACFCNFHFGHKRLPGTTDPCCKWDSNHILFSPRWVLIPPCTLNTRCVLPSSITFPSCVQSAWRNSNSLWKNDPKDFSSTCFHRRENVLFFFCFFFKKGASIYRLQEGKLIFLLCER